MGFTLLRALYRIGNSCQLCIRPHGGGTHQQGTGGVNAAAYHTVPGGYRLGNGFAGHSGGIDGTNTLNNFPISGNLVSG